MTNKKVYNLHTIKEIYGKHVRVYFNLHRKTWSIKDKKTGLVLGYSNFIPLKNCKFIVSEKGRQRVLKEKRKNVHAYVDGIIGGEHYYKDEVWHSEFTYNPYKYSSFVRIVNNEVKPVYSSDLAYLVCENGKPRQRMINFYN